MTLQSDIQDKASVAFRAVSDIFAFAKSIPDVEALQADLDHKRAEVLARDNTIADLQRTVDDLRRRVADLDFKIAARDGTITRLQNYSDVLRRGLAARDQVNAGLKFDKAALLDRAESAEKGLARVLSEREELADDNEALRHQVFTLKSGPVTKPEFYNSEVVHSTLREIAIAHGAGRYVLELHDPKRYGGIKSDTLFSGTCDVSRTEE